MSGNSEHPSEVYNYFLELSKPTEEDLKRVFTEEELKELCLKHKCKVDIWRWNIVDDYRTLFTRSGRYQKWSERDRLRMLAKAVNKIKPALYNDEEIRKTREEEWKFQLKENILSLNYWKRRRLNVPQEILTESNDIDPEVQSQFEIDTESINTAELLTASQRQELENTPDINKPVLEVQKEMNVNKSKNVELNNKLKKPAENLPNSNEPVVPVEVVQVIDVNIIEAGFDEDYLTDKDSEDSLETVMLNDNHPVNAREILQSDEVAPEIENIYDVNTMSMTIDSEMSTQSQSVRTLQSQDVIPPNYDNFKNIIPLTSTQSQTQNSEEIIVS